MTERAPSVSSALKEGTTPASDKEKHEFLVALLKESRYGLIDFMFKQVAVLTLISGWIVSSDAAQKFIGRAPIVRGMAVCVIGSYSLLFVFWAWSYRLRSAGAYTRLSALGYMPADFYSTLLITRRVAVSLVSIHLTGCVVLIALLFQI